MSLPNPSLIDQSSAFLGFYNHKLKWLNLSVESTNVLFVEPEFRLRRNDALITCEFRTNIYLLSHMDFSLKVAV